VPRIQYSEFPRSRMRARRRVSQQCEKEKRAAREGRPLNV
jgi:hypothetical protein